MSDDSRPDPYSFPGAPGQRGLEVTRDEWRGEIDAQRIARVIAAEVEAHPYGQLADTMTDLVAQVVAMVALHEGSVAGGE